MNPRRRMSRRRQPRASLVLIIFLGIAAFFLLTEHAAHLFGILPYLLLLLCPVLHLLMHGGHGRDTGDGRSSGAGAVSRTGHDHRPEGAGQ